MPSSTHCDGLQRANVGNVPYSKIRADSNFYGQASSTVRSSISPHFFAGRCGTMWASSPTSFFPSGATFAATRGRVALREKNGRLNERTAFCNQNAVPYYYNIAKHCQGKTIYCSQASASFLRGLLQTWEKPSCLPYRSFHSNTGRANTHR